MLSVRQSIIGSLVGRTVLDFGAGAGRHAYWAFSHGANVVAVDLSFAELEAAPAYFAALGDEEGHGGFGFAVQGSGLSLPFEDSSFDVVIASEVFEHIPNDKGALDEITRVLRPGGMIAISVPRFVPELAYWAISSSYHNVPGGHIRIYRRSQLHKLLSSAGYNIIDSHHSHALHTPYWLIRCVVGIDNTDSKLYKAYHRFLVWDITKKPRIPAVIESALNPIFGKSLVVYAMKAANV